MRKTLYFPFMLLLLFFSAQTFGQEREVAGNVTDAAGVPLPGVTVSVKGASIGAVTDFDGEFSVQVPGDDAVLVFSSVGFETQEERVGSNDNLSITLPEDVRALEEVVVVGYGVQKRVNLTGSVSNVDFDQTLENRPITNASQALAGRVPGLSVSQTSGQPGNDAALLRIRGWGTMNDAKPMVVIDGAEGSMNQINPNDIESVSILKDAASAAIYGSKAANGVILITTKDGGYNEKPQVRLSSYVGAQSLASTYDIIDNSAEYMGLWNQALINKGSDPIFPEDVIADFRNNNDPYLYPNTNFFDEVYRTAIISEHNLSVSGGSEDSKYFFSLNRLDQEGIMKQTDTERYGLNLKVETRVAPWLNIGAGMNSINQSSLEPYNIGRVAYVFSNGAYPFTAPYNKDGTFGAVQAFNSAGEMIVGNRNPLIDVYDGFTKTDRMFTRMNAFADITFTDFLTLKSNFTTQNTNQVIDRSNEALVGYTSTGVRAENLDFSVSAALLAAERRNVTNFNYIWFNTLNFNKELGKHDVSAVAGMQIESTKIRSAFARKTDPPKEGLTQVSAGTSGTVAEGDMQTLRLMSYFGRINYAFSDRYLFEANVRADASSRFAPGQRWGVFPGISVGWRISEEEFMSSQNLFSELKLRGSWGRLGNQDIAGYWPYLTTIAQNYDASYNYGGSLAPGAAVTSLVDESITWETTTASDVGLEMYFLNNRLSLETSFFNRKTEDIIVRLPIPQTLGGVGAPFENVGEMVNMGLEINANYVKAALNRDDFGYSIGANFTYVTNEVTKFRGGDSPDQLYLIREGYSYRSLYAFNAEGIYQTDQEAQDHMSSNGFIPEAGDLKYQDMNGDGALNFEDMTVIGNTIPKYNFGANLDFSYKGFDLSFLLQGVAGVTVDTKNAWTQPVGISGGTITTRWRDAWTPENPDTDIPNIKINDPWNSQDSSFWMVDLSYLKVKNIQLGYKVPSGLQGLQSIYFYLNAENYLTWVSEGYEGYDPERSTFNSGYDTYPLPKVISVGINLGF